MAIRFLDDEPAAATATAQPAYRIRFLDEEPQQAAPQAQPAYRIRFLDEEPAAAPVQQAPAAGVPAGPQAGGIYGPEMDRGEAVPLALQANPAIQRALAGVDLSAPRAQASIGMPAEGSVAYNPERDRALRAQAMIENAGFVQGAIQSAQDSTLARPVVMAARMIAPDWENTLLQDAVIAARQQGVRPKSLAGKAGSGAASVLDFAAAAQIGGAVTTNPMALMGGISAVRQATDLATGGRKDLETAEERWKALGKDAGTSAIFGAAFRYLPFKGWLAGQAGGVASRVAGVASGTALKTGAAVGLTSLVDVLDPDGQLRQQIEAEPDAGKRAAVFGKELAGRYAAALPMMLAYQIPNMIKAGQTGNLEAKLKDYGLHQDDARRMANAAAQGKSIIGMAKGLKLRDPEIRSVAEQFKRQYYGSRSLGEGQQPPAPQPAAAPQLPQAPAPVAPVPTPATVAPAPATPSTVPSTMSGSAPVQAPVNPAVPPSTPSTVPSTMSGNPAEAPAAPRADLTWAQVMADDSAVPIYRVPVSALKLSKDVPNFKEDADTRTGVVRGQELQGSYTEQGTGTLVAWERLDGSLEVITGRHRLDLARRSGKKTLPVQVMREADGFSATDAMVLDSEMNIRDGQGKVRDYANFFKNSKLTLQEASGRGLLARDNGRKGWALGRFAGDSLYTAYRNDVVKESKAAAIAEAAPNNDDLQRLGLDYALQNKAADPAEIRDYLNAVQSLVSSKPGGDQLDMFGNSDAAMNDARKLAKAARSIQAQLTKERQVLTAAIKMSKATGEAADVLKKYGVVAGDSDGINDRLQQLVGEIDTWNHWATDPAKVARVRVDAGLVPAPVPAAPVQQTPVNVQSQPQNVQSPAIPAAQGGIRFLDVTPEGYGPQAADPNESPRVLDRLAGESLDAAIARHVGYQVDNGRVKLTEDRDGWTARVGGQVDGAALVKKATSKQQVLNQVFGEMYPGYKFAEAPAAAGEAKPWDIAEQANKPYADSLRNMPDKDLSKEDRRVSAALNAYVAKTPAILPDGTMNPVAVQDTHPDKQEYWKLSAQLASISREQDRRAGTTNQAAEAPASLAAAEYVNPLLQGTESVRPMNRGETAKPQVAPEDLLKGLNQSIAAGAKERAQVKMDLNAPAGKANNDLRGRNRNDISGSMINSDSATDAKSKEEEMRVSSKVPFEGIVKDAYAALAADDFTHRHYAFRMFPDGASRYNVGDTITIPSFVWVDGNRTEDTLSGVSGTAIEFAYKDTPNEVARAWGDFAENNYHGTKVALLAADRATKGEDIGEIVLDEPVVLAVWGVDGTPIITEPDAANRKSGGGSSVDGMAAPVSVSQPGYADPKDTLVPTDNAEFTQFPVELPEFVRLARIMHPKGKAPSVKRGMRGNYAGVFRHRPDGSVQEIDLKASIFQLVPAHEQAALRDAAFAEALAQFPGKTVWDVNVQAAGLAIYEDKLADARAAAMQRNPAYASKVAWHEMGHWIDYVPQNIIAGRGNILGRLKSAKDYFSSMIQDTPANPNELLSEQDRRKLRRDAEQAVGPKPPKDEEADRLAWSQEVSRIYAEKVAAAAEERGLVTRADMQDELEALLRWYNGTDDISYYQAKSSEMYADTFSALMNNPAAVRQRAPLFWKSWHAWLVNKPEAGALLKQIQEDIRLAAIPDQRHRAQMESQLRADDTADAIERELERKTWTEWKDLILQAVDRRYHPVYRRATAVDKKGLASGRKAHDAVSDWLYHANTEAAYMHRVEQQVIQQLRDTGIPVEEFNVYLENQHIIHDRADIASMGGMNPFAASQALEAQRVRLGDAAGKAMEAAAESRWQLRQQYILGELEKANVLSPELMDHLKLSKWYSTVAAVETGADPVDALFKRTFGNDMSSRIHKAVGYLGDAKSPLLATMRKDLALLRLARSTQLKINIGDMLADFDDQLFKPAEMRWDPKHKMQMPVIVENDRVGTIVFLQSGQPGGYYAPRAVVDAVKYETPAAMNAFVHAARHGISNIKALYTSLNYGFWPMNYMRDVKGAVRKLPGMYSRMFGKNAWITYRPSAHAAAKSLALGNPNELAMQALDRGVIMMRRDRLDDEDGYSSLQKLMLSMNVRPEVYGIKGNSGDWIRQAWRRYLAIGQTMEWETKIVGMMHLDKTQPQMSVDDRNNMIRQLAGSANFVESGTMNWAIDWIMSFFNPAKQYVRSEYKAWEANPWETFFKTMKYSVLPKLLKAALLSGGLGAALFGKRWAEEFRAMDEAIPDYDRDRYDPWPLMWVNKEQGKVLYFRGVEDEFERTYGSIVQQAMDKRMDWRSLFDYAGGQLPGLNPLISTGMAWGSFLDGNQPRDKFGPIVSTTRMDEGAGWSEMAKYTANQLGAGIVVRFTPNDFYNPHETRIEKILRAPVVSNTLGRFFRVSNAGLAQKAKREVQPALVERARMIGNVREMITNELKTGQLAPGDEQYLRDTVGAAAYYRERRKQIELERQLTPYQLEVLRARGNPQKLDLLDTSVMDGVNLR